MKKKILMICLLLLNCVAMTFPWFKTVDGNQNIYGFILLQNPIALTCLLSCFIGIWMKYRYSHILETIGWLGIIIMQIYEFLTWHIRTGGGSINLQLSCHLAYSYFYLAVMISIISYIIYKIYFYKISKDQYNHMLYV